MTTYFINKTFNNMKSLSKEYVARLENYKIDENSDNIDKITNSII